MSAGNATISTGKGFMAGGAWATQRLLAAIKAGRKLSTQELRTLDTLQKDEWKHFDDAVIEEGKLRLSGVADLISRGLTVSVPNAFGKTIFEYEKVTDMEDASVSMNGLTRTDNDRVEFDLAGLPLPIIHKDFNINLRTLEASRTRGEGLDTLQARISGRKVAEMQEQMLFVGSKTFGGNPIYGYTTHPQRNTTNYGTGGAWSGSKTGDQILQDVLTMIGIAEADRAYGPYVLYVDSTSALYLNNDFKANSDKSIRQRLLEIEKLQDIKSSDKMVAGSVLLVQMLPETVVMVDGEPIQTIQWDVQGGMQVNFKVMCIQVPLVRVDAEGRSGIVHMRVP